MRNRFLQQGIRAAFLLSLGQGSLGASDRLSQWFELPPAMRAAIGDPRIVRRPGSDQRMAFRSVRSGPGTVGGGARVKTAQRSGGRQLRTITVTAPSHSGRETIRAGIAEAVLDYFWETEEIGGRFELIRMDRERFVGIGAARLLGRPSADSIETAWWKVRMRLPLETDSGYHLIAMVARYDRPVVPYGHFAFGVRKDGGSADGDFVIDPRAPWGHHEPPGIRYWVVPDPNLINGMNVNNLYDWLYTQTFHRGLKIDMRFVSLAKEQVVLVKRFAERDDHPSYGSFGPRRNNCASLSREIFQALMPVDRRFSLRHPIADLPARVARKTGQRFGVSSRVLIRSREDRGEPTARSEIHRVSNRAQSVEFEKLRELPGIN